MDKSELLTFLRGYKLGVQSSVAPNGAVQSAVVGFAISDKFELFFDTVDTARKVANLRRNPKAAFVIGGLTDEMSAPCNTKGSPTNQRALS